VTTPVPLPGLVLQTFCRVKKKEGFYLKSQPVDTRRFLFKPFYILG